MKTILTAMAVVGMLVSGGAYAGCNWNAQQQKYVGNCNNSTVNTTTTNTTDIDANRSGILSGNNVANSFNGGNDSSVTIRGSGTYVGGDYQEGGVGGNVYNRGGRGGRGGDGGAGGNASVRGSISGTQTGTNTNDIVINNGLSDDQARDLQPNIITDSNNVTYEGDEAQKRNPVSTAIAAPLVTSNDTCMGSTSAGGQGITLGLSFATTWRDADCVIRKDARFLHNASHEVIALSLMCEKDSVRAAVARAGSVEKRLACGLNADGSDPEAQKVSNADDFDIE